MIQLAVTRFDNNTYQQNKKWRESRQYNGCIYGSSVKIKQSINPDVFLIVLEMNNSLDKIEGIGVIKNSIVHKKYDIYDDKNYNRYIYKSNFRLDKKDFDRNTIEVIEKIEKLLFRGKSHMKRGQGINILSDKHTKDENYNYYNYFINLLKVDH
jgi:hypothetical protein